MSAYYLTQRVTEETVSHEHLGRLSHREEYRALPVLPEGHGLIS